MFRKKTDDEIMQLKKAGEVPFLMYPRFEETNLVKHGFSTRLGGVSEGEFSSMNLSFTRGDRVECVQENFTRICNAIGVKKEQLVYSKQTHTSNVRIVNQEDCGKGVLKFCDYDDVDGLITDKKDVCLVTSYADCVPLFFLDPVNNAIGLSHAGWKGTVGKIGKVTLEKMANTYNTKMDQVLVGIGPSICQDCYEVSEDVIVQFKEYYQPADWNRLFYKKENGKYQLDLWSANEINLLEAGVKKENIVTTNICTCCNSNILFSHRASKGKRGNLCAFLALK